MQDRNAKNRKKAVLTIFNENAALLRFILENQTAWEVGAGTGVSCFQGKLDWRHGRLRPRGEHSYRAR